MVGIGEAVFFFGSQCVLEFAGTGKFDSGACIDLVGGVVRKQVFFAIAGAVAAIEVLGIDVGIHIRFLSSLDIG